MTLRIYDLANGSNDNSSTGGTSDIGCGSGTLALVTPAQCLGTLNGHSCWFTHIHYWEANNIMNDYRDAETSSDLGRKRIKNGQNE